MGDVKHVARLHDVQIERAVRVGQISRRIGRGDLIRRAAGEQLAVIGKEADVLVAELDGIGLRHVELEAHQPRPVGAVLDLGDETRTAPAHGWALHGRDEILQTAAAVGVFGNVDPTIHQR